MNANLETNTRHFTDIKPDFGNLCFLERSNMKESDDECRPSTQGRKSQDRCHPHGSKHNLDGYTHLPTKSRFIQKEEITSREKLWLHGYAHVTATSRSLEEGLNGSQRKKAILPASLISGPSTAIEKEHAHESTSLDQTKDN